jgi:branched-chain amino acid aminotransferase
VKDRICYFNGDFIRESEARVNISDWFIWEGGVYEVARTYNHIPFRLEEHINRMFNSLNCLPFIKFNRTPDEVLKATRELLKRNEGSITLKDDYRVIYRISRGVSYATSTKPTFFIHLVPYGESVTETYKHYAKWYKKGVHMVVASTRQIPVQCLDPKIKHTNRLCNRLAQHEAMMVDPEAVALMLDIYGNATECPRDSFFMVKNGRLLTSRMVDCLPGITRDVVMELAAEMQIECVEAELTVYDLYNADEIMIVGTSIAIAPVSRFNQHSLPAPIPGPVTSRLQTAFSRLVDYDIVARTLEQSETRP